MSPRKTIVKKSAVSTPFHLETDYKTVIQTLRKKPDELVAFASAEEPKHTIEDEIIKREHIRNEGLEQDIHLKKMTLVLLFLFLGIETLVIFGFAFLQAIHNPWNFHLEEWSFKLLIAATITQITVMLQIAVKHLFPEKKD